jgi:hypothetical protein
MWRQFKAISIIHINDSLQMWYTERCHPFEWEEATIFKESDLLMTKDYAY